MAENTVCNIAVCENGIPLANRIISTLAELYADQMGVEIDYKITERSENH